MLLFSDFREWTSFGPSLAHIPTFWAEEGSSTTTHWGKDNSIKDSMVLLEKMWCTGQILEGQIFTYVHTSICLLVMVKLFLRIGTYTTSVDKLSWFLYSQFLSKNMTYFHVWFQLHPDSCFSWKSTGVHPKKTIVWPWLKSILYL